MMALLKLIAITSILVLGYTAASQEGMVLYPIRQWAEKQNMKWVEPFFLCHWCMPSVWTAIGFLFAWRIGIVHFCHWSINYIFWYILTVCGSSMVCGLVWAFYQTLSQGDKLMRGINDWNEQQDDKIAEELKERKKTNGKS